DYLDRLLLNTS
ncbi:MAG: hypothetical protein PWP62_934, partial [Eubacteriaceae bacterium]|nr:hypothetical protein [Eubacteriaceae bacterium]